MVYPTNVDHNSLYSLSKGILACWLRYVIRVNKDNKNAVDMAKIEIAVDKALLLKVKKIIIKNEINGSNGITQIIFPIRLTKK
jgi:hypothetical protein